MAYLRPGVYVEESLNPIPPVVGADSESVAAFIGAADRGPTTPTLVTSWNQYTSLFGSWGTENTLTTALYLFFANGGSRAYVTRVAGTSSVIANVTLKDRTTPTSADTLKLYAKNAGAWGNSINVSVTDSALTGYFDLTVFYGGTYSQHIVERFTDLTMLTSDPRYAVTVINSGSNYITAEDKSFSDTHTATDNPSTQANTSLASGADGTAPTSANLVAATSLFDTITSALILNVPGITSKTDVDALTTYASGRGDVFVVVDALNDTVSAQLTRNALYNASSYAAVYYPNLTIPNPQSYLNGATVTANCGGAVVGKFVATDVARGVFKAPAGLSTQLSGVVSVTKLTNAELDSMNSASAPANAIRYVPGSGIVIMGARTLKAGYADRYVPVRRSLIYLNKSLNSLTQFAIFEPNDELLWRKLRNVVEGFLTNYWQQGGLRGASPAQAFFVKCDSENNPTASIENGEVHVEVGVALQRPAEFVIIRISQYDNGSVVTIS